MVHLEIAASSATWEWTIQEWISAKVVGYGKDGVKAELVRLAANTNTS